MLINSIVVERVVESNMACRAHLTTFHYLLNLRECHDFMTCHYRLNINVILVLLMSIIVHGYMNGNE